MGVVGPPEIHLVRCGLPFAHFCLEASPEEPGHGASVGARIERARGRLKVQQLLPAYEDNRHSGGVR